eukprot:gene11110-biopygen6344
MVHSHEIVHSLRRASDNSSVAGTVGVRCGAGRPRFPQLAGSARSPPCREERQRARTGRGPHDSTQRNERGPGAGRTRGAP